MARLIVVSNRVQPPGDSGEGSVGGLAMALAAALREHSGVWFGWSGQITPEYTGQISMQRSGDVTVATVASDSVVLVRPHRPDELNAAALSRSEARPLWILPNDEILALIEDSTFCNAVKGCFSIDMSFVMIDSTSRPLPRPVDMTPIAMDS